MSQDREHLIRERAYAIWQAEGTPEGRDQEHWARAEREVVEDGAPAPSDVERDRPRPSRPRRKPADPPTTAAPSAEAPIKRTRSGAASAKPARSAVDGPAGQRRGK